MWPFEYQNGFAQIGGGVYYPLPVDGGTGGAVNIGGTYTTTPYPVYTTPTYVPGSGYVGGSSLGVGNNILFLIIIAIIAYFLLK